MRSDTTNSFRCGAPPAPLAAALVAPAGIEPLDSSRRYRTFRGLGGELLSHPLDEVLVVAFR
jgi:hypothetical protein